MRVSPRGRKRLALWNAAGLLPPSNRRGSPGVLLAPQATGAGATLTPSPNISERTTPSTVVESRATRASGPARAKPRLRPLRSGAGVALFLRPRREVRAALVRQLIGESSVTIA